MTLYRATLRQALGGGTSPDAYKWSNVWYVEASDPESAGELLAGDWVDILRVHASVLCYAYEVYVSDLLPGTTAFTTVPIAPGSQRGLGTGMTGDGTDLYNPNICLRVDLPVSGGFASRKWHRCGLNEAAVAPGGLIMSNTTWQSQIVADYAAMASQAHIRDESGNAFTGATLVGLRPKRLGKFARFELPVPPAFG